MFCTCSRTCSTSSFSSSAQSETAWLAAFEASVFASRFSSWEAIQAKIFARHGCTQDVCHGEARSGGLDLRPDAAYASLFEADSLGSPLRRIEPGDNAGNGHRTRSKIV